jgi:hypothetical protein
VRAGYIVAYNNFSPSYQVRFSIIRTLPDVKTWSDVTFVEWQEQAEASGLDIKGLKYVIRYHIVNTDTKWIIQQAAGESSLITWPGVNIPMSDEKGRAVLGTPNGVGIAYLLATHKAQLGQLTVESVRVWSHMIAPETYFLFVAFKIGPASSPASSSGLP